VFHQKQIERLRCAGLVKPECGNLGWTEGCFKMQRGGKNSLCTACSFNRYLASPNTSSDKFVRINRLSFIDGVGKGVRLIDSGIFKPGKCTVPALSRHCLRVQNTGRNPLMCSTCSFKKRVIN